MDKKTQTLRDLMQKHKLTNKDVGALLGRPAQTVRIWSCANGGRVIPDNALELLQFKVAAQA